MYTEEKIGVNSGLPSFMSKIYAWMAGGILLSALTVYTILYTFTPLANAFWWLMTVTNGWAIYGFIILELFLVFSFRFNPEKVQPTSNYALKFIAYSFVNGLTLAIVLLMYTEASIFNAFISTFALFGAMSIIGFITKKDLSKLGGILLSMLIGLIISSVINLFLFRSSTVDFVLSIITVLIFTGLTAYDTQKCKAIYATYGGTKSINGLAIVCALELYLDFINLFLGLLRIFGKRR